MNTKQTINDLYGRVMELECFADLNHLRIEPALYPKGLFRAKPKSATDVRAYTHEIKQQIAQLETHSQVKAQFLSQQISQKIMVLVNSFRTQPMRKQTQSKMQQLANALELNQQNALTYFSKVDDSFKRIESKLKQQLQQCAQLKNIAAATDKEQVEKQLKLQQEIGKLEQAITQNKELLESMRAYKKGV